MVKRDEPKEPQHQSGDEESQAKFEHLPDDVLGEIAKHLPLADVSHLARTHKRAHGLFKPALDTMAITTLLEHVVRGEQDEAEKMIKSRPELLTMRETVTDYSGRTFENITPFEYTLWALDRHMWEMMLKALPDDKKGQEIKLNLLQQYKVHVRSEGVHYTLDRQAHTEQHYDFALRDKLKEYVDKFDSWTWQERDEYWRTEVGRAQRELVVHGANEYCRPDRSFDPTPQFKEGTLPRKLDFYNYVIDKSDSWFPLDSSRLGSDFGIMHGGAGCAIGGGGRARVAGAWGSMRGLARLDLAAITALCEVRTLEFKELGSRLESELEPSHPKITRPR